MHYFHFGLGYLATLSPIYGRTLNSTSTYTLSRPCAQPMIVSYRGLAYTAIFACKCPHRNLDIVNARRQVNCNVKSRGSRNKLLLVSSGLDMPPSAIYFSMWFSSLVRSRCYRCAHLLLVSVKYLKSMRMASHICGYLQNCYLMWRLP